MKKKSPEDFLKEAINIHGNTYTYPDKYINARTKINIECHTHGIFSQLPQNHLIGQGCPECNPKKKLCNEEVINRFIRIHGDKYDYSNVVYNGVEHDVKIECKSHGFFNQKAHAHLNGHGCPKCSKTALQTTENIVKRFKDVHGDKYDYSNVIYENITTKVKIGCNLHGDFLQAPSWHISGHGCIKCRAKSFSEAANKWLSSLNIEGLQTHDSPGGEFKITGTKWKADGYDEKTNTIYEFHGTFWHGHPSDKSYKSNEKHPRIDSTWDEIYKKTLERDSKIIELGYNLVVKWEHEK
jgi:Zn finger protein HypA/HybF involved in hydrogenase expression